jgi:hypothetical protein
VERILPTRALLVAQLQDVTYYFAVYQRPLWIILERIVVYHSRGGGIRVSTTASVIIGSSDQLASIEVAGGGGLDVAVL